MKENDKWINKVRARMEEYSEPVPVGLWDQLEKELDIPKVVTSWRRWHAVAAVVMLLLLSSITAWIWQLSSLDYMEKQSAKLELLGQSVEKQPVFHTPSTSGQSLVQLVSSASLTGSECKIFPYALTVTKPLSIYLDKIDRKEAEEEIIVKSMKEGLKGMDVNGEQQSIVHVMKASSNYNHVSAIVHRKQERGWSIGLSTTNGTFSSSQMDGYLALPRGTQRALMNSADYDIKSRAYIDKVVQFANLAEGEVGKSDVKYRMPITVGLSLRFDLFKRWAIETGLTYTQLSSEVRSGARHNNYSWEDKLHYVGIPLKLNRKLWSNERFEVYASVGGAVEKCVAGKQTLAWNTTSNVVERSIMEPSETDIKVKALQWSLATSAGAQFKMTDRVGLYIEPGLVYYFNDGSDVNTIRKEHPFNFNLQLGVRLTVSK